VKRNDDLLREMLFRFEEQDDWLITMLQTLGMSAEDRTEFGHLNLLVDAGLVVPAGKGTFRLSNSGYDYIQAIRDDNVWKKTQAGAAKVGGMTLAMMKDLAVSYVKQEAAEKLGITL
jgi:hypothetical protein